MLNTAHEVIVPFYGKCHIFLLPHAIHLVSILSCVVPLVEIIMKMGDLKC